ncbi:hypothetical protein [Melghirimyces algeriensis]|uniref:Uncharacterized protein n=1 Tax=Melghirimyces algeriensis TaxID=910412 RepID=A0A521F7Z9_9BACL|nr:hypothetical protein [Melghirimyces algeriensis]SMO92236.1 hypothetical protein SAMN06264849_11447 [Melghirimyces algeriensis]
MENFKVVSESKTGRKLNELYNEYKAGDPYAFTDAMEVVQPRIESYACYAARRTDINDPSVYFSFMLEAAWKAFDTFEDHRETMFTTYFSNVVNKAAVDVKTGRTSGSHKKYSDHFTLVCDEDSSNEDWTHAIKGEEYCAGFVLVSNQSINYNHFEEIPDRCNVENTVVDKLMVNEQRDLIDDLCVDIPSSVHETVQAVVDYPRKSFNSIAEILGVHHSKIIRNLRKISGKYNTKLYGDLNDYLYRSGEYMY